MNERIRELAERCETKEIGYYFFDREKFAELIVEECSKELSRVPGGYDSSIFYKNSKILKEHFGVEE